MGCVSPYLAGVRIASFQQGEGTGAPQASRALVGPVAQAHQGRDGTVNNVSALLSVSRYIQPAASKVDTQWHCVKSRVKEFTVKEGGGGNEEVKD